MILILISVAVIFVVGCFVFRSYFTEFSRIFFVALAFAFLCNFLFELWFQFHKTNLALHYVNESTGVADVPVVLWWTPFGRNLTEVKSCYNKQCVFTENRNFQNSPTPKAFSFYGSSLNLTDLPVPRNYQFWALLHEESLKNAPPLFNKHFLSLFNYTSTFSRYSHLPLTTLNVKNVDEITSMKYFLPVSEKNKFLDSIAPVLYIQSNCDTLTDRDAYIANLSQYIKIDSYGKCLNNAKLPDSLGDLTSIPSEEFLHFVSRYKFTIGIENAVCDDYITEKLWRPIIVGSVPVYFGSPYVRDWLPNYDSAILISDFSTPEKLAKYILHLNRNDDHYEQYIQHKLKGKVSNRLLRKVLKSKRWYRYEELVDEFECHICAGLHKKVRLTQVDQMHFHCEAPSSILTKQRDVNSDWNGVLRTGSCQGKVVFDMISKNTSFTSFDLDKEVAILMSKKGC